MNVRINLVVHVFVLTILTGVFCHPAQAQDSITRSTRSIRQVIDQQMLESLLESTGWETLRATIPGLAAPNIPVGGLAPPELDHLDTLVKDFMNEKKIVGLQVAITRGERLLYNRAFGYANRDIGTTMKRWKRMRIGSVSKLITAMAALKLTEEYPDITLDTKVYGFEHLGFENPGILDDIVYSTAILDAANTWQDLVPYMDLTLRHLLTHTSGFDKGNAFDGVNFQEASDMMLLQDYHRFFLSHTPLINTPGNETHYENQNMGAVGVIVEEVSGMPFEDYVRSRILDPLGLDSIVRHGTDVGAADAVLHIGDLDSYTTTGAFDFTPQELALKAKGLPAGGWTSSAEDFVRLLSALDTSGAQPNILLGSSIDEMHIAQFPGSTGDGVRSIAWKISDAGRLSHNGNSIGYRAFVAMYPADYSNWTTAYPDSNPGYDIAPINIAIHSNSESTSSGWSALSNYLCKALAQSDVPIDLDYFDPIEYGAPIIELGSGPIYAPAGSQGK